MTTSPQEKSYERHLTSLEASDQFAKGAREYQRRHRIKTYTEAAEEYAQFLEDTDSDLNEVMIFGEAREKADETRVFTPAEADEILLDMTHAQMKQHKENYPVARQAIEDDPVNLELVKSYHECR
jgi:hypothetical protein